jgi:hypothetical protein
MAAIIVQHSGWLGLKAGSYVVLVDGNEIGHLGRTAKRVEAQVDAGAHTVEVVAWGRSTGVAKVDALIDSQLVLDLVFPVPNATIFWRTIRHRTAYSREKVLNDVMRLELR